MYYHVILFIFLLYASTTHSVWADIYKWTDEKGVVNYSNQRPNNFQELPTNSENKKEDENTSGLTPKQIIELEFSWSKNEFGTMGADFIFRNTSNSNIKDIEITCIHFSRSGTMIDKNIRKIYEILPAKSKMEVKNFNMGFIHSQAYKSYCSVTDFDFSS